MKSVMDMDDAPRPSRSEHRYARDAWRTTMERTAPATAPDLAPRRTPLLEALPASAPVTAPVSAPARAKMPVSAPEMKPAISLREGTACTPAGAGSPAAAPSIDWQVSTRIGGDALVYLWRPRLGLVGEAWLTFFFLRTKMSKVAQSKPDRC